MSFKTLSRPSKRTVKCERGGGGQRGVVSCGVGRGCILWDVSRDIISDTRYKRELKEWDEVLQRKQAEVNEWKR